MCEIYILVLWKEDERIASRTQRLNVSNTIQVSFLRRGAFYKRTCHSFLPSFCVLSFCPSVRQSRFLKYYILHFSSYSFFSFFAPMYLSEPYLALRTCFFFINMYEIRALNWERVSVLWVMTYEYRSVYIEKVVHMVVFTSGSRVLFF